MKNLPRIAGDTNILVYAHPEGSLWKGKAIAKVTGLANSGCPSAITGPSVHEFLAVVTHPKIYAPPSPLPALLAAVKAWRGSPNLRFLKEGPGYFEKLSPQTTAAMIRGPKIHDVCIAAICLNHGVKKLWTADRDFLSVPELSCEDPLVCGELRFRNRLMLGEALSGCRRDS